MLFGGVGRVAGAEPEGADLPWVGGEMSLGGGTEGF